MKRLLLLALVACQTTPSKPAQPLNAPTAAEVLARLQKKGETRANLRALGRVTYFGEKGRVRLKTVIVVDRPRRFRVETLSPLEQPIDVLTSDGERLSLLHEGRLYEGPATPENIARVLPLPLHGEDLVTTFLGGVPVASGFEATGLEVDGDRYELALSGPGGRPATLSIQASDLRVERAKFGAEGSPDRLELEFDKFEPIDGGDFARAIKVSMPGRKIDLDVQLRSIEVNSKLEDTLFELAPPPGVVPSPLPSPPAPGR